jgi:competence protein ComEC
VAVISAGKGNPFGHPHAEVVERLNARVGEDNVYCTIDRGTIEFITDGQRLWVRTGV